MTAIETLVRNMTIAQLASVVGIDVRTVVLRVLGSGPFTRPRVTPEHGPETARRHAHPPAAGPSRRRGSRDTRTKAGRAEFDSAIVAFLAQ